MSSTVTYDIQAKQIDSVQKLHILFFFHQHPEFKGTSQEIEERLYLGNDPFIEGILTDLKQVGLLNCSANRYMLPNQPEVTSLLQRLAEAFKNPLTRQEMLNQIGRHGAMTFFYRKNDRQIVEH